MQLCATRSQKALKCQTPHESLFISFCHAIRLYVVRTKIKMTLVTSLVYLGNIQRKVNRNPPVLCSACLYIWPSLQQRGHIFWNSWLQAPWMGFCSWAWISLYWEIPNYIKTQFVFLNCEHSASVLCWFFLIFLFCCCSITQPFTLCRSVAVTQCNKHDTGNSYVLRFNYQLVSFCVLIVIRSLNWKICWDISCEFELHVSSLWKKFFSEWVWKKKKKWKV